MKGTRCTRYTGCTKCMRCTRYTKCTRCTRCYKNVTKLDFEAGNDKKYEVEAIWDSTIFVKKLKFGYRPEICLFSAKSTWEPVSVVWPLQKLVSAFIPTS